LKELMPDARCRMLAALGCWCPVKARAVLALTGIRHLTSGIRF